MNRSTLSSGALDALSAETERRAAELRAKLASRRTDLPLRYWRQQAHLTTPADNEALARKAVEGGTSPTGRLLERWKITSGELAERLDVDDDRVEALLASPRAAPLVVLDAEDATAPREDAHNEARRVAIGMLRDGRWGTTLRFFRPPGFNLPGSSAALLAVLAGIATGDPTGYPLDGIVFPKIEHPEEVELLYGTLSSIEAALGLTAGQIRVGLLVESAWCVARLPEIAEVAAPRLASLIFGLVDYSADLGLAAISMDRPLADWARAQIVNVAGAVGVPSLDGMTLAYPMADASFEESANRERFLDRMALCYRDACRARDLGMTGKWVGHPAQLFATLLAFDTPSDSATFDEAATALAAYGRAVDEQGRGTMMIGGTMSDRATDRHARVLLRRAVAQGRFDVDRSLALGVIGPSEVAEARALAGHAAS